MFYDTLYRAMDGDWQEYQYTYGDMLEHGFSPDKINKAMNRRMAEEVGLSSAARLPVEWSAPGEDEAFDGLTRRDGGWLDALDPERTCSARDGHGRH